MRVLGKYFKLDPVRSFDNASDMGREELSSRLLCFVIRVPALAFTPAP